jgi:predicted phosphodiesterase
MRTYAILSDIHGNSRALKAVLEDMQLRGVHNIINLGDHVFGALEPEGTAELLRQHDMICIYGNKDRDILESLDKLSPDSTMEKVIADLSSDTISWLRQLPPIAIIDDLFFACHGTPESDSEYLLEEVNEYGVFVYDDEVLVHKTANIRERIILCGHSHVNRVIYLSNGKIILNPGSVGLPAYLGNGKHRFAMESMTPHAKYAIVQSDGIDISIEQVHCPYDWKAASETAKNNGRDDWASWLLKGRMPTDLHH